MEKILESCKQVFDKCSRPFGISKVILDEDGKPLDAIVQYLNQAMAESAQCKPEDMVGQHIYEMWPDGNYEWLEHFYRAAYFGESTEFETVNIAYKTFMNVITFPVAEGYCAYEIQDVTTWMEYSHPALESMSAGMFYYGPHTHYMMLTESTCECCGIDQLYVDVKDFAYAVFDEPAATAVYNNIVNTDSEYDRVLLEEQAKNGKWIRVSMSRSASPSKFSIGFVEDVTSLREAEESSARRSEIIESLSSEYFAIYMVNLKADHITPYLLRNDAAKFYGSLIDENTKYTSFMEEYCKNYVVSDDLNDEALELTNRDYLLAKLQEAGEGFTIVVKRRFGSEDQFIELRMIKVASAKDDYILAARNINHEMKDQLHQKETLQSALTLAQHASQAKTTFLTNISHDFRTPLNSIMGFSHLALETLDDKEGVRDILGKILLSSEHLLNLVNDILDVSRIESGKVVLEKQPIDLQQFSTELLNSFLPQAIENNLEFNLDTSGIKHF